MSIDKMIDMIEYNTSAYITRIDGGRYEFFADGIPAQTIDRDAVTWFHAALLSGDVIYYDTDVKCFYTRGEMIDTFQSMPAVYREKYDNNFEKWLALMRPYTVKRL